MSLNKIIGKIINNDLKEKIPNDSISNIESIQNEQESDNKGIDITRSIVKKNANSHVNQYEINNNENNKFNNKNLNNILNKNKKKADNKIERLDFLSSSFQNSFQSNSNNIDINKIPIHNNKIFNNVFHVKPTNYKGERDYTINGDKTSDHKADIEPELAIKKESENEKFLNNMNKKKMESFLNNANTEMLDANLEREYLKKNLGVYETTNYPQDLKNLKEGNMDKKIHALSIGSLYNDKNESNKNNTINSVNEDEKNYNENSLDKLKKNLNSLDEEKTVLEKEIIEMRKKIKNIKKEDYNRKIIFLEKERDDCKKTANNYLHLCSQLAEEVIVLRNQLDKYTHFKKDK